MENKMIIRQATVSDCDGICKICTEDLGYSCQTELVRQRLCALDQSREAVFVAEADGAVAGFIHIEKYNVLYFRDMANILGLAVAKKYRKQGYGKALMRAAGEWAKNNRIGEIRLNSGAGRKEAHAFYRAIGFDREKEQITFYKQL